MCDLDTVGREESYGHKTQLLDTIRSLPLKRQTKTVGFVEFIKHHRSAQRREMRPVVLCQGEFTVADDFEAPLPESVLRDFDS